jgi:ribonuclease E
MKVNLPSGGYLFIQTTEALTVIDVNSGKFTNSATQDETILKTNIEAVHEIARQLRLRNIGGMIIIDFIDMTNRIDKLTMMEELELAMEADKAKPQVGQLSDLGLVEMTRHRQGQAISEIFAKRCPHCQGNGYIMEDLKFASATAEGEYRAKAAKIKLPMNDRKKFSNNKFKNNENKNEQEVKEVLQPQEPIIEQDESPSVAAQTEIQEIKEEKQVKAKSKGRGRKKIKEADIKTDDKTASTVLNSGAELEPVIDANTKKADDNISETDNKDKTEEPKVSDKKPAIKRSRRPNRGANRPKRTKAKEGAEG